MLARRELRQLAQRVTARYHLRRSSRAGDRGLHPAPPGRWRAARARSPSRADALAAVHQALRRRPAARQPHLRPRAARGLRAGDAHDRRGMVRRAAREAMRRAAAPTAARGALPAGALAAAARARRALGGGARAARPSPAAAPPAAAPLRRRRRPRPRAGRPRPRSPLEPVAARPASATRSLRGALARGAGPLGRRARSSAPPLRTHLDQVRRLDLPVVLEMFHPARRDTCYRRAAAPRGRTGAGRARARARRCACPLAELDRLWTRQAVVPVAGLRRARRAARRGARGRLGARRASAGSATRGGDRTSRAPSPRFQRDAELAADGVIGARTLMTLYSRGRYPRPRLPEGGAS